MSKVYLGVDVGSVSTNLVLLDEDAKVLEKVYLRTMGNPISAVQEGLRLLKDSIPPGASVCGTGTTGSGRELAAVMIGADAVKNEITAHGIAALSQVGGVSTILEIGGQDSKIIIIRDGVIVDFAMNTVCAAGTGSFLDRQASRLGIPIEEFGDYALKSRNPVRIAGRCAVFAESDMIHKQQLGCSREDIIAGLCEALVRNYMGNVGKGKEIQDKVVFQGGVAANAGIANAFSRALGVEVFVPEYYDVMGAIGAGLLAMEAMQEKAGSQFRGFEALSGECCTRSIECNGCSNCCEIVEISLSGKVLAYWGSRCGKYEAKSGACLS
jgi:predicted CoA-substrate-specific enzyme activase